MLFCSLQQQQSSLYSQSQHLATAFPYLHSPLFDPVWHLSLRHSSLDANSIAQLTVPDWYRLRHLDISTNKLSADAFACLAKGNWPELQHLDVSMCGLNTATMTQLVQGKWPELWTLNLSANSSLDGVAMSLLSTADLSTADWPHVHNRWDA